MRTQGGRSANDILALFDRLGDPFAADKNIDRAPGSEGAAAEAKHAEQAEAEQKPVEVKLGFDQEDRGLSQQPQQPQAQAKQAEKKDAPREAPKNEKDAAKETAKEGAPRENKEAGKQGKESLGGKLQHGLLSAFAKLASLAKGEAAEKEHAAAAKDGTAQAHGALEARAGRAEQGAAEVQDKANHGAIVTEGDGAHQEAKSADKKDARLNDFREELRAMENGRDARKIDKPKEGKEAHELVKSEAAQDAPELRELIGHWHPETCNVQEEEQRANALRIEDALGEQMRCRGILEDGARCIRKPVLGIPYCREHASAVYAGDAGFVIGGPGGAAGPPEVTEPEALAYVSSADAIGESSVTATIEGEELADPTIPEVPAYGEVISD